MADGSVTVDDVARFIRKARLLAAGYSEKWIAEHSAKKEIDGFDLKVARKLLPDFDALIDAEAKARLAALQAANAR